MSGYGDAQVGGILRRWASLNERTHVDQEALATVVDVWSGMKLTHAEIRKRLLLHLVRNGEYVPVAKIARGEGHRWGYPDPADLRAEANRLDEEARSLEAVGDDRAADVRHTESLVRDSIRLVIMIRHACGKINHKAA